MRLERRLSGRTPTCSFPDGVSALPKLSAFPGIYAECTGGAGITTQDLEAYVRGSLSVMAELNMLPAVLSGRGQFTARRLRKR